MTRTSYITLISLILCSSFVFGQEHYKPKKIKAKGDYMLEASGTTFPMSIDNYSRDEINAFNEDKTNICASYVNESSKGKTTLSVYVYPAGIATDERLRREYLKSLQAIATVEGKKIYAIQTYCSYKKDGYRVNGYKATVEQKEPRTLLELYECGNWFFKIRVTTDILDSLALDSLDQRVLNLFIPTELVKRSHLLTKAHVNVAEFTARDSMILDCTLASAIKKCEWTSKNVDSLERASGFPTLYLTMYVEAWKAFAEEPKKLVDEQRRAYKHTSEYIKNYVAQINSVIESGYLNEFIMEQFDGIMIAPENTKFDFEGYAKWKSSHPITINPHERFYVLNYDDEGKKSSR